MILSDFKIYRQHDAMDCGPTCLKMIFRHYGRQIPLAEIQREVKTGKHGSSLLGIADAAEKFGFRTLSARLTFEQLFSEAELPCILHWDQYHFVVLTPSSKPNSIVVADPAEGLIKYSKSEFVKKWVSVQSNDESKGIVLLLTPRNEFFENKNKDDDKSVSWRILTDYALKYKPQIFQLFIGLLIGSLLQLIFPFLTQSIVDTGINTQNLHFIQIILIAQFALFFGQTVLEFIRSRILLFISTHVNLRLISDFWVKLMRLPLNFFDTRQTGDILQRINDHKRIETFITGTALQTIFSVFNLLVFSVVLFIYSTTVFVVFAGASILYFIWIKLFLRARKSLDHKRFSALSKENSATMQLIAGMPEIKLNNAERLKRWEWEKLQAAVFKLTFKSLSLTQHQQVGAFFLNQGKNILITYLVARDVIAGELTLGVMLAIQYIIGQLNGPIDQLISFSQQAQDAKLSLERLNEIHTIPEEEKDEIKYLDGISFNKSISLKEVEFTYPGAGNHAVLKNINVTFETGKVTAIVGVSGSGKSTLLKLLQLFYENYKGEIRIGEHNLRYLRPRYWRSLTGSVMQEGYIFSDTIERNIVVGEETVDYKRLIDACHIANLINFIESLPLGFNTRIGIGGNGISTGQRQRILIARAVYKNPAIMFFDEATNALDSNNERQIMDNLTNFFKDRTVIIVAHRLSTVRHADKIVVLESGSIIEEGDHAALTSRKGKYYELVKNQLELGE